MKATCEYLVREDEGHIQQRCGRPATHGRNGPAGVFTYCESHADQVQTECARLKMHVNIFKLVGP